MEPLIFLGAMAVLFWFLLIRPQRRRQSARKDMVADLSAGDEIVTIGGIIGTVRSVADNHVVLEIAPGTEVRVAKEAVANTVAKPEESKPEESPPAPAEGG